MEWFRLRIQSGAEQNDLGSTKAIIANMTVGKYKIAVIFNEFKNHFVEPSLIFCLFSHSVLFSGSEQVNRFVNGLHGGIYACVSACTHLQSLWGCRRDAVGHVHARIITDERYIISDT